jgi:hypothetical protein
MHRKRGVVASTVELDDRDLSLVDLGPTILHLLGERVPEHLQGCSMLVEQQETESGDVAGLDV